MRKICIYTRKSQWKLIFNHFLGKLSLFTALTNNITFHHNFPGFWRIFPFPAGPLHLLESLNRCCYLNKFSWNASPNANPLVGGPWSTFRMPASLLAHIPIANAFHNVVVISISSSTLFFHILLLIMLGIAWRGLFIIF